MFLVFRVHLWAADLTIRRHQRSQATMRAAVAVVRSLRAHATLIDERNTSQVCSARGVPGRIVAAPTAPPPPCMRHCLARQPKSRHTWSTECDRLTALRRGGRRRERKTIASNAGRTLANAEGKGNGGRFVYATLGPTRPRACLRLVSSGDPNCLARSARSISMRTRLRRSSSLRHLNVLTGRRRDANVRHWSRTWFHSGQGGGRGRSLAVAHAWAEAVASREVSNWKHLQLHAPASFVIIRGAAPPFRPPLAPLRSWATLPIQLPRETSEMGTRSQRDLKRPAKV